MAANFSPNDAGAQKSKKRSSAASNVAQAKLARETSEHIDSIFKSRLERGIDVKTGATTLIAIFPQKRANNPHRLNLSFLLEFPNLQTMFADAFLQWGDGVKARTRDGRKACLQYHFFGYLKSHWSSSMHPADIDDEVLIGFKEKLLNRSEERSKALHPTTVSSILSYLRVILFSLTRGPWTEEANRIAEQVPSGLVGSHRDAEPIAVLGMHQLLDIIEAAEQEVRAISHRFANGKILIGEGYKHLQNPERIILNSRNDYKDFSTCLAALHQLLAAPEKINEQSSKLFKAMEHFHGYAAICPYLFPSTRDIVPFVILLSIATVFNPETVVGLRWSDIDFEKDHAGTAAIEIIGRKDRAASDLPRLLDPQAAASSRLSLMDILELLREITSLIRSYLPEEHIDHVFVFASRHFAKGPRTFAAKNSPSGSEVLEGSWGVELRSFIRKNELPKFTLSQLRPSILDLVQFMDGSLEAARKVGNHRSPITTWTHYTSGAVKSRYRERIGQVILLRERWLQTDGIIDPRLLSPSQDKGAATPGFICLNPFDSPRPNQQPGRLCKDYGGCPSCPLAAAIPSDPLCVAQYTALEIAIYRSQGAMNSKTWVERWTPVLADLASLRAEIPQSVLADSRKFSIVLPNVG